MSKSEYYYDERGSGTGRNPDWERPWRPPDDPSGGGFWGGGGSGGGSGGSQWNGGSRERVPERLNADSRGRLLVDLDGRLLVCPWSCPPVPAVLVYLRGEGVSTHARCVLIENVFTESTGKADDAGERPAVAGCFALPEEKFTVLLKWQRGHYDHAKVSQMRAVVYGVSCGWMTVGMNSYRAAAQIRVTPERKIYVNGFEGKFDGNAGLLSEN